MNFSARSCHLRDMTWWQSHPTLYFTDVYIWKHCDMVPRNHIHNYEIKFKENHKISKNVSATPLSRKWQHHSWEQTLITMLYKIQQAQAEINARFIHFNVPRSHPENLMIIERHLKFLASDRFTVIWPFNITVMSFILRWIQQCCGNDAYRLQNILKIQPTTFVKWLKFLDKGPKHSQRAV